MTREAGLQDAEMLEGFLARHPDTSMFLRDNLAQHGVGHGTHPQLTRFFISPASGKVAGVVGLTKGEYLLCQIPGSSADHDFARALAGCRVQGMTGDAAQTARLLRACGLRDPALFDLNHAEPLLKLDLARIRVDAACQIRKPGAGDEAQLVAWFEAYLTETGLSQPGNTGFARARAEAAIAAQSTVRLLVVEGEAVAMAALNAQVADWVQVGGVYVPKSQRNRGYGRKMTAALLAEARALGATVALLFANNPAAAAAYRAIGFEQVGTYRVALLAKTVTLAPQVVS